MMGEGDVELSLVIPVYNEVKAVGKTVEEVSRELSTYKISWEVLIVDDGSDDGTSEALKSLPNGFRLITHKRNRGYGAALKTGIRQSRGRFVAITDSDLTYPIGRLRDLYDAALEGEAMVVGARTGGNVHIPLLRRFPKWVLKKLASYLAEHKIPDLNSGFRVFDKQSLLPHLALMPNGFSFTTTITLVMLTRNEDVRYLSIDYHGRVGSSKIRPIRDTLLFFQLIIRTVTLFQPLKIFMPLALMFVLSASAIAGYYVYTDSIKELPDATLAILVVTGVVLFALGLLADLVSRRVAHLHELIIHDSRR